MKTVLLSIAYLPPVHYFAAMARSENIILEKHEHFIKQTYRNRALIYGANGVHQLIIPIRHDGLYRKPVHELKISYESPWQKIHWRTITSAYRNSPYFEYFEDDFSLFYETKTETLFEFNFLLMEKIHSLVQIPFNPAFTSGYQKKADDELTDLRNAFHPADRNQALPAYQQVFAERHGFIPDLSIVDLLFNKGPDTKEYLAAI